MHRPAASTFFAVCALVCLSLTAAPPSLKAQAPPIPANHVRIHYFRPDGNYLGWTVYAFGDTTENTSNFSGGPRQVTGRNTFGALFDVGVTSPPQKGRVIIYNGDTTNPGPKQIVHPPPHGN